MRHAIRVVLATVAVMASLGCAHAQRSDFEIMRDYGAWLFAHQPANVRGASNLVRARWAFTQYCEALDRKGVPVNATLPDRLVMSSWTCADHANNVQAMFQGFRIPDRRARYIQASNQARLPIMNDNHGGWAVEMDGEVYVFDAWFMAVENTNAFRTPYSGSDKSPWNGMPLAEWERRMHLAGYSMFSSDGGTTEQGDTRSAFYHAESYQPTPPRPPVSGSPMPRPPAPDVGAGTVPLDGVPVRYRYARSKSSGGGVCYLELQVVGRRASGRIVDTRMGQDNKPWDTDVSFSGTIAGTWEVGPWSGPSDARSGRLTGTWRGRAARHDANMTRLPDPARSGAIEIFMSDRNHLRVQLGPDVFEYRFPTEGRTKS